MGFLLTILMLICITELLKWLIKDEKNGFDTLNLIPVSVNVIVIIMYIMGIFHLLKQSIVVVIVISLVGVLVMAGKFKKREKVLHMYVPFLILGAIIYLSNIGRTLVHVDEYSHWAIVAKDMFFKNILGNSNNSVVFLKDYPPATALFEYLIVKLV